jgi:hypothetical protein
MAQVDNIRELLESTATGQHLLLGEFVLPFAPGEADPTGVTSNVTDGRAQLWIDDEGTLQLSVFSRTLDGWTDLGASALTTEAQESTTDIKDVLVNAGLLEDEGITPLDLDGGDISAGGITMTGEFAHSGATFGVFGTAPASKPTIFGDKPTQTAIVLGEIITAGVDLGLWTDGTT